MKDLKERLQDESLALQGEAWRRRDGGQDCSLSATLAEEALEAITQLEAEIAALREGLGKIADGAAFREQRFAEDNDADYFLRAQRKVQQQARALLDQPK